MVGVGGFGDHSGGSQLAFEVDLEAAQAAGEVRAVVGQLPRRQPPGLAGLAEGGPGGLTGGFGQRAWMKERQGAAEDPLFPTRAGTPLTRDAVRAVVEKHAATAAQHQPSLAAKKTTPHVLRHSCAMALLCRGVDRTVIATWLGHEQIDTVSIYTHADMTIKERALACTKPQHVKPGRYRPRDRLLAFLDNL